VLPRPLSRSVSERTHGGDAGAKRGASTSHRKREVREWDAAHGKLLDLSIFEREILPGIQTEPARRRDRTLTAVLLPHPPRGEDSASKTLAGLSASRVDKMIQR
jgi:hypothetical protein